MILSTQNLAIGYGSNVVQKDLNVNVRRGELICVLGINGCGKSTLFRTLSGLQRPLGGHTFINGKDVLSLTDTEKALLFSLVLTERMDLDNTTVSDVVALGRYPYSSWLGGLSEMDKTIIQQSLEQVHLLHKTASRFNQLSDGERQRVMIAKALAQNTPLILLDEPTAHLDLPNRMKTMLLLRQLTHQTHKAILLSTHELDLALQAADRIWLMKPQGGIINGLPEDLVLNGTFQEVFANDSFVFNTANGNFSMHYTCSLPIHIYGDRMRTYWTVRALARLGYCADEKAETSVEVSAKDWIFCGQHFTTLEALIEALNPII